MGSEKVCMSRYLTSRFFPIYVYGPNVTPVSWQLPLWQHLLWRVEEQPETWRGHNEVAEPGSALCWRVAKWSPGISTPCTHYLSLRPDYLHQHIQLLKQNKKKCWKYPPNVSGNAVSQFVVSSMALIPAQQLFILFQTQTWVTFFSWITDSFFVWQHGRGTHLWNLKQADESQYSLSHQYTGDFVQGQRHGQGTFHFANGAIYEGEWRNNKSHAKVNLQYTIASHILYTYNHKFSENPEWKL